MKQVVDPGCGCGDPPGEGRVNLQCDFAEGTTERPLPGLGWALAGRQPLAVLEALRDDSKHMGHCYRRIAQRRPVTSGQ